MVSRGGLVDKAMKILQRIACSRTFIDKQSLNRSRNFPPFINNEVLLVQCCEYFIDMAWNKQHETEGSLARLEQPVNPALNPRYPTHILSRNF